MKNKLLPIFLNDMTLSWIETRLSKATSSDFIADMLKKEIESSKTLQEKRDNCEHEAGEYFGEKRCCKKCDSFYGTGCYESWTLREELKLSTILDV